MADQETLERVADLESYKHGFVTDIDQEFAPKGLSEDIVRFISAKKGEPEWMLQKRLLSYNVFTEKPLPFWGADLGDIDFEDIYYYKMPKSKGAKRVDRLTVMPGCAAMKPGRRGASPRVPKVGRMARFSVPPRGLARKASVADVTWPSAARISRA